MNLEYYSTLKLIKAMASNASLSLNIDKTCTIPYTDGSKIVVPPKINHDEIDWEYMVFHEIRHNSKGRDMFGLIKDKRLKMQSFLGYVLNILEDFRIEYIDHDEYKGEEQILKPARAAFLRKQIDVKLLSEDSKEDSSEFFKAMFAWDAYVRSTYNHHCMGIGEEIKNLIPAKANEYLQKLLGYESRLLGLNNAEECYQLALDIIKDLGLEQTTKQKEEEAKEQEVNGTAKWAKYADMVVDHHHGDGSHTRIIYDENDLYDYEYELSTGLEKPDLSKIDEPMLNWIRSIPHTSLGNNVRKLLQVRSKTVTEYGKKRGKLNNKALHKVGISAGSYSQRIFKDQIENLSLDVAVSVLVDCSGSMLSEKKYAHAARAGCMLNDALGKIRVPVEISGFSENYSVCDMRFKRFEETVDTSKLEQRFSAAADYMGNNADGESILLAYDRIKQHKAKRKLLIVLSDGSPASKQYTIAGFTKKVCASIEAEKLVELYGIGISDNNVRHFYKDYVVINDPSELESKLLEVIKKKVIR